MVKKKSHSEGHDKERSLNESTDNQTTTDKSPKEQEAAATAGSESAGSENRPDGDINTAEKTITMSSAEEELLKKLTEMQDRYLRLSAEYDNYRRRTLREKIELTQTGGESVILKLLPVIDDFDRAMESIRTTEDCNAVKQGLELIYNKIYDFLRQSGVREVEAMNEPFNSDLHEAVTTFAVEDSRLKGVVIDVTQKGYTLNDKVIRYPKVVVGE